MTSLNIIVVCALASVLSNDFAFGSGVGTSAVAIKSIHPKEQARPQLERAPIPIASIPILDATLRIGDAGIRSGLYTS
ncbi:MAG TPA: hypothetical protein VGU23_06255, partial [Acidobacteriaceae bacterium]|nr:hypothetical protein [Acidobacteriaceae bacterium]